MALSHGSERGPDWTKPTPPRLRILGGLSALGVKRDPVSGDRLDVVEVARVDGEAIYGLPGGRMATRGQVAQLAARLGCFVTEAAV